MFDSRLIALQTERILLRLPPFNHLSVDVTTGGGHGGGGGGPSDITDLVYTLSDADNGKTLSFANTIAQIVVAPLTLTTGFACSCKRNGAGMLHIFPRSGLTVVSPNGYRVDTGGTATLSLSGSTLTIGGDISTDLVAAGGIVPADFAVDSQTLTGFTWLDGLPATIAIRQYGLLRGVKFRCAAADNSATGFNYRVFAPPDGTIDGNPCVYRGKTEYFAVPGASAGTDVTRRFTTQLACIAGDRASLYTDSNANAIGLKTGGTVYYVVADKQADYGFGSESLGFTMSHQPLAAPPLIGACGDSIMAGTNSPGFISYPDGGPYGHPTAQMPYQLRTSIGNGMEFQNYGSEGQRVSGLLASMPAILAFKPAWVWAHIGLNDVLNGENWSDFASQMDDLKALLVNGERLFLNEVLPATGVNDSMAAIIRNINDQMATWCTANGATLIICHDAMGQNRVSTGHLDDLLTAYNKGDNYHLSEAGAGKMAQLFEAQAGLT